MERKPKVFVSYAREDLDTALEIYEYLKENGCRPWIDDEELLPGQEWEVEIRKAIRESDFFVACLSQQSVSKRGFVQSELKHALEVFDEFPDGQIFLIPVLLQECNVPEHLKKLHWVDWSLKKSRVKLIKAIGVGDSSAKGNKEKSENQNKEGSLDIQSPQSALMKVKKTQHESIIIKLPGLPKSAKPFEFVRIPAGKFLIGSPEDEKGRDKDEGPQHWITIQNDFYMGKYPVTQAHWAEVMGHNPSRFGGRPNHPVERVSWNDCQKFVGKLNQLGELIFRLPSESEWEYACRAGTQTRFYWGDDPNYKEIDKYCWYDENSKRETHEVGIKTQNQWNLYDMSGNVWEWCEDNWHFFYEDSPGNGQAWTESHEKSDLNRVLRGGSWRVNAENCRSAFHTLTNQAIPYYSIGFRVVLSRT